MTKGEFINTMSGQPWAPDGLHCWELVRQAHAGIFDRHLPDVPVGIDPENAADLARAFSRHAERQNWREVQAPIDGSIAMMGRVGGVDIHCGVFLVTEDGESGVLHCDRAHGVRFLDVAELRLSWGSIRFFAPAR